MARLTMSLDDDLASAFDAIVRERGYANRSEAFRDLVREHIGVKHLAHQPDGPCVATLSYLYNHHQRQLALRLTDIQHEHHDLSVATLHAHLDHDHCIEVAILRGSVAKVQGLAQSITSQPGVSHGQLHMVPVSIQLAHGHSHAAPVTNLAPARPKRQAADRGKTASRRSARKG